MTKRTKWILFSLTVIIMVVILCYSNYYIYKINSEDSHMIENIVAQERITIKAYRFEQDIDKDGKPDINSVYVWNGLENRLVKIYDERIGE